MKPMAIGKPAFSAAVPARRRTGGRKGQRAGLRQQRKD
jgi:hypothetical protein